MGLGVSARASASLHLHSVPWRGILEVAQTRMLLSVPMSPFCRKGIRGSPAVPWLSRRVCEKAWFVLECGSDARVRLSLTSIFFNTYSARPSQAVSIQVLTQPDPA